MLGAVGALAASLHCSHRLSPGQLPSRGTRWAQEAGGFFGGNGGGVWEDLSDAKGKKVRLPVCQIQAKSASLSPQ